MVLGRTLTALAAWWLLMSCVAPAAAQNFPVSQACAPTDLVVDNAARTVTTATPFPVVNCSVQIACPQDQALGGFLSGQATGTAWFTVKLFPAMAGAPLRNVGPPVSFHNGPVNFFTNFSASALYVQFLMMSPADTDRQGGFRFAWQCNSFCPARLPLTVSVGTKGVINDTFPAPAPAPIVCNYRIQPQPCDPVTELMSWTYVKIPRYTGPFSTIDPNWRFLWFDTPPSTIPIYFPFTGVATEQFLQPSQTIDLQVRVLPGVTASWQVNYYCTPFSLLGGGTDGRVTMATQFGVLLSDPDGQGPLPFANAQPLIGQWSVRCDYDQNVDMNYIAYKLDAAQNQRLTVTPPLGSPHVYNFPQENLTDVLWGAPMFDVDFYSESNFNQRAGFTLKYECHTQCALGAPTKVVRPAPFRMSKLWHVNGTYADMCRWEVQVQCPAPSQLVRLHLLAVPSFSETYKVIIDYDTDWFLFAFPDRPQGPSLLLPPTPFNLSVRGFPNYDAAFDVDVSCESAVMCNAPWSDTSLSTTGAILSDADGADEFPYLSPFTPCTTTIKCSQIQLTANGSLVDGSQIDLYYAGALPGGAAAADATYSSVFVDTKPLIVGPLTVQWTAPAPSVARAGARKLLQSASARGGNPGGFEIRIVCLDTPTQAPTTNLPPGTPMPTATAAVPTTAAPTTPPPSPSPAPPTSPSPTNATPSPNTTGAPSTPPPSPPPLTPVPRTLTVTHTVPILEASAAADSNVAIIAAAAAGGLLGLLLLALLIFFIVLRVKKMSFREAIDYMFHDPGRYTKGFSYDGDDTDLQNLVATRATNDMRANEELNELDNALLFPGAAATAAAASGKAATRSQSMTASAKPTKAAPPPPAATEVVVDDSDI